MITQSSNRHRGRDCQLLKSKLFLTRKCEQVSAVTMQREFQDAERRTILVAIGCQRHVGAKFKIGWVRAELSYWMKSDSLGMWFDPVPYTSVNAVRCHQADETQASND